MTPHGQFNIRILTAADVPKADELRALAGWNQTTREWELRRQLEPDGCFLAERDGVLVGTVTTTCYGPRLAWIDMMLVHPDHRRLGIGAALFGCCLEHLQNVRSVTCVKLDATPLGQPLYERFGFKPETNLTRWQRAGAVPLKHSNVDKDLDITPRQGFDKEQELFALDAAAFGCPRSELLRASLGNALAVVHRTNEAGRLSSYGAVRAGSKAYYLGPIVSPDAQVAEEITRELLGHVRDGAVYWDLFDTNRASVKLARTLGFTPLRPLVRMFLGSNPGVGRPEWQWGIVDPATG